jgi:predicted hydrocarbon binding protein
MAKCNNIDCDIRQDCWRFTKQQKPGIGSFEGGIDCPMLKIKNCPSCRGLSNEISEPIDSVESDPVQDED